MGVLSIVAALVIPLGLVLAGWAMYGGPSDDTSTRWGYGYRSKRSLTSRAAKIFADKYAGRLWLIAGSIMFLLSLLVSTFLVIKGVGEGASLVILVTQILSICCLNIPVELALRRNFDENGEKIH